MSFWKNRSSFFPAVPGWIPGLCLGLVFLGIGIYLEQLQDIFQKAIMICLECIGIG